MRTALTLLYCGFRSGQLRLDCGVVQAIAALNQFFQPLGETCCRGAIDDILIKTDRQTQIVSHNDLPVHDPWLLANAATRRTWRASTTALSVPVSRARGVFASRPSPAPIAPIR